MAKINFNMGEANTRNLNHIGFTSGSGRMLSDPETRPSEFYKSKEQSHFKNVGSKILSDFSGALSIDRPAQTEKATPRDKVQAELSSSRSDRVKQLESARKKDKEEIFKKQNSNLQSIISAAMSGSGSPSITTPSQHSNAIIKLTNMHNEQTMLQKLGEKFGALVNVQMTQNIHSMEEASRGLEKQTLNTHIDIERVLTQNCNMCICYKLHNKRLLAKSVNLSSPGTAYFDRWIDLPPQVPFQNWITCYGIVQTDKKTYVLSDFVSDNLLLPRQMVTQAIMNKLNDTRNKEDSPQSKHAFARLSTLVDGQFGNLQQIAQNQETYFGKRINFENVELSLNTYQFIKQLGVEHFSNVQKIPDSYFKTLIVYIYQVSRAMAHAHKHGLIHGNLNLSKVLVQKVNRLKIRETEFDKDFSKENFFVTNFEPFQVQNVAQQIKAQEEYSKLFGVKKMKLNDEDILQLLKRKDLIAFANSVIEIMVAKHQEKHLLHQDRHSEHTHHDLANKSLLLENSLDSIPLNWVKVTDSKKIMKILQKCIGPQKPNNNIDFETWQIFEEVNQIAADIYNNVFGQKEQNEMPLPLTLEHKLRLKSVNFNNRAVATQLQYYSDSMTQNEKIKMQNVVAKYLDKALEYAPNNFVALLNKLLLTWQSGLLRDDEFTGEVETKLLPLDRDLARLVLILFKKNAMGERVKEQEMKDSLQHLNKKSTYQSQLSQYLFKCSEFFMCYSGNMNKTKMRFMSNIGLQDQIHNNHRIEVSQQFETKVFNFSNNDQFVVAIGVTHLIIIDCAKGEQIYKIHLPNMFNPHEVCSSSLSSDQRPKESDEDEKGMIALRRKSTLIQTIMSQRVLTQMVENNDNASPQIKEKLRLFEEFPSQWKADITNNGKLLAIFDYAQQKRNRVAKFPENKQELMFVYSVVPSKHRGVSVPSTQYMMDMQKILNNQEVLDFSHDDFCGDQFTQMIVQAKDLCIYVVDFEKQQVLRKIGNDRHSILRKSVFFDFSLREENRQYFDEVKDFIQIQEAKGNQVKLPKINHEIIAVKEKDSLLIKLYNIQSRTYCRKFLLTKKEYTLPSFEPNLLVENDSQSMKEEEDYDSQSKSSNSQIDQLAVAMNEEKIKSSLKKGIRNINKSGTKMALQSESERLKETGQNKVILFDISPLANLIVAHIGNEIFIRRMNQTNRSQASNSLKYHQSINFMPLYLDNDFNFHYNREILKKYKLKHAENAEKVEKQTPELTLRQINEIVQLNKKLIQGLFAGSYEKNEKVEMLSKLLQIFIKNPVNGISSDVKNKMNHTWQLFSIYRNFYTHDLNNISSHGDVQLSPLITFQQFILKRSFQNVNAFAISSTSSKFLLAVVIDRQMHLYDYSTNTQLFQIQIKTTAQIERSSENNLKVFFLDQDNIVAVQTTNKEVLLASTSTCKEIFAKRYVSANQQDITLKIEEPITNYQVDMGFGVTKDGNFQDQLEGEKEEDSDDQGYEMRKYSQINTDFEIAGLHFSRNCCQYAYLIISGKMCFTIYYIYEEQMEGCEFDEIWKFNYRFNRNVSQYGQHNCFDFNSICSEFVSGTNSGYICKWLRSEKQIEFGVQITDQKTKKAMFIDKLGWLKLTFQDVFVTFSGKSQTLQSNKVERYVDNQSNQQMLQITEKEWKTRCSSSILPYNNKVKGNVTALRINERFEKLIASFQDGSATSFCLKENVVLSEIETKSAFYLDDSKLLTKSFLDENCSVFARLCNDKQSIEIGCFDWNYKVKRLKKPPQKKQSSKKLIIEEVPPPNLHKRSMTLDFLRNITSPRNNGDVRDSKTCSIF